MRSICSNIFASFKSDSDHVKLLESSQAPSTSPLVSSSKQFSLRGSGFYVPAPISFIINLYLSPYSAAHFLHSCGTTIVESSMHIVTRLFGVCIVIHAIDLMDHAFLIVLLLMFHHHMRLHTDFARGVVIKIAYMHPSLTKLP